MTFVDTTSRSPLICCCFDCVCKSVETNASFSRVPLRLLDPLHVQAYSIPDSVLVCSESILGSDHFGHGVVSLRVPWRIAIASGPIDTGVINKPFWHQFHNVVSRSVSGHFGTNGFPIHPFDVRAMPFFVALSFVFAASILDLRHPPTRRALLAPPPFPSTP